MEVDVRLGRTQTTRRAGLVAAVCFVAATIGCGGTATLDATSGDVGEEPDDDANRGDADDEDFVTDEAPVGASGRSGSGGSTRGSTRDGGRDGARDMERDPDESDGEPSDDPSFQEDGAGSWCDVQPILQKSCNGCHDGQGTGGSPMGLTQPADFAKAAPISKGKTVAQAVSARTHDRANPMPPRGLLPAADLAKLDAWINAGAPAPEGSCAASEDAPTESAWPPPDCDEVYEFRAKGATASSPYSVPPGNEYHPQIYHDAPWGSQRVQAIGFKPITDNQKVLHHWILYNGMAFLVGWAPGDDSIRPYPKDVGMDMPTGRRALRLDMHYYNTTGTRTEQDRSGVAVCIVKGSKLRPNVAAVTMGLNSLGPVLAPANRRDHNATGTCRVSRRVTILTASPHAHKYATHMKFVARKANGQQIVMHDQPFKFGEQGSYVLDPPVVLDAGDTIVTTCTYTNNTNRSITFGESTENEMCFNFAVYYPKGALGCSLIGGLGN